MSVTLPPPYESDSIWPISSGGQLNWNEGMGSLFGSGFSGLDSFSEGFSISGGAVSSDSEERVIGGTWRESQAGASSRKWSILASAIMMKSGTTILISSQVGFCCNWSHSAVFHPSKLGSSRLRWSSLKLVISSHAGVSFQPSMVSGSLSSVWLSSSYFSSQDVQCLVGLILKVRRGEPIFSQRVHFK